MKLTKYEDDLQRQLNSAGSGDEVQYTERFAMSGYDFIITAGHGFLVVPNDSPDYLLAKKIVKYGHKGLFAIYLEEDDEMPKFLEAAGMAHPTRESIKKIKLTNEDISKYATEDELYLLEAAEAQEKQPLLEGTQVGKKLLSWDESKILQAEADDMRVNWKDRGLEGEPTEAEINDMLSHEPLDWAWEDFAEDLNEILKKKNPEGYWKAEVKNFGWRELSGSKTLYAKDAQHFLTQILPDTNNTFHIYNYGKGLAINNFHHDSPTGREWYYVTPIAKSTHERGR
jgi:hypothetical protein